MTVKSNEKQIQNGLSKLNLSESKAVFNGCRVKKWFNNPGDWFEGHVKNVETNLAAPDKNAIYKGLHYLIRYDDGDQEHVTLQHLWKILTDDAKEAVQAKFEQLHGSNPTTDQKKRKSTADANPQPKKRISNAENDDVGSPAASASLLADTDTPVEVRPMSQRTLNRQAHLTDPTKKGKRSNASSQADVEEEKQPKRRAGGTSRLANASNTNNNTVARAAPTQMVDIVSSSNREIALNENGIRTTGLPGHLKCIELINFMCHSHMTMDFGPHVTFVSGTNGSGKSAALQALQCCLGVKASQTGRTTSLQHFVKTGSQQATVRVTIFNKPYKGYDAFQHELYGDTITVERRISGTSSSSSYFLKNAQGIVVSKRKDDLEALLSTLGINAANPVTVMTQDTARNFLAGSANSADKVKYSMYMEATQLGQIAANLAEGHQQIKAMEDTVMDLKKEVEQMAAKTDVLRKTVSALRGIDDWRQEQRGYEHVLAWVCVDDVSAVVADLTHKLEVVVPERQAVAKRRIEDLSNELEALKAAKQDKDEFMENFLLNATNINEELEELKRHQKDLQKQVAAAKRKAEHKKSKLCETQENLENLNKAAAETLGELDNQSSQVAIEEYTRQLNEAKAAHADAQEKVAAQQQVYQEADAELQDAIQKKERASNAVKSAGLRVQDLKGEVEGAQQGLKNRASLFGGPPMITLLASIQREQRNFTRMPIGPIGQHLSVKDNQWAIGIEASLGQSLNVMLCHNRQDLQLLQRLVNQAGFPMNFTRPNLVVVRLDLPKHNITPNHQPPPNVPTIMRMLEVSDPAVETAIFNYLVDSSGIEKAALAPTMPDAKRMVDMPRVFQVLTRDGSKAMMKGRTLLMEPPPYWLVNKPGRLNKNGKEIAAGTKAALVEAQKHLQEAEREKHQAELFINQVNEKVRAARVSMAAAKKLENQCSSNVGRCMDQLNNELESQKVQTGQDEEDGIQQEVFAATQEVYRLEAEVQNETVSLQQLQEKLEAASAAVERKKAEGQRLGEENAARVNAANEETNQLASVEEDLETAQAQSDELDTVVETLKAALEEHQEELSNLEKLAPECCSRQEAEAARQAIMERLLKKDISEEEAALMFTRDSLKRKIDNLKKKIQTSERQAGGSLAEKEDELAEAEQQLATRGRRARSAVELFNSLEMAHKQRKRKLKEVDLQVERVVAQRFNMYMRKKGYFGKIELDRPNRTLSITVLLENKNNKQANMVTDLKQLSGGERSYTTVAFALALGGETNMPFRAMDEFDVFMDAVNRRVAMTNLLSFAREQMELQFVFLTPQDLAAVEEARQACCTQEKIDVPKEFVKIVQMKPARENAIRAD